MLEDLLREGGRGVCVRKNGRGNEEKKKEKIKGKRKKGKERRKKNSFFKIKHTSLTIRIYGRWVRANLFKINDDTTLHLLH